MPTPTSSPSTLTDRYVSAVLRAVPGSQRAELEPEVRALVADAIDARAADAALSPADAERAALTELGDPSALAARYSGRTMYLLGPGVYPIWVRTVGLVLGLIVPIVSIAVLAAQLIGGSTVGEAIARGVATAYEAAVQTLFWFTLVLVIIERVAGPQAGAVIERGSSAPARPWRVDDLPELPDAGRVSLVDVAAMLAANVFVLVGLLIVQLGSPITIEGESYPLFDPALWSFWLPWFIGVTLLEIVFTIAVYTRGRWTYAYAIGNAALGAAFAIPAVYLLANDLLFNPALVDALAEGTDETWLDAGAVIIGISVVVIVAWDAIDGFRKARRASVAAETATAG